jgi:uncharacterized membrane protein
MNTNQGSYAGHDYEPFDFRDEYESQEWEFRRDAAGYEPRNTRLGPRRRAHGDRGGMNLSEIERWASIIAGAGLLLFAVRQRRGTGIAAGALGAGLIARGSSGHCPVYAAAHVNTRQDTRDALGGPRGVLVHKTMTINRPVEDVYRFWRDLSNLPRCMQHLESVTPLGNGRSHWIAKGPAGMRVEWDAEIINEEENRVIGWRSLEHADVVSAGSVNFRECEGGAATEIVVRLQYSPPAGRMGALIARLFGEEPSQQIQEDLHRVKQCLETGAGAGEAATGETATGETATDAGNKSQAKILDSRWNNASSSSSSSSVAGR